MILSGSLIHGMSYSILINQMKIIQDYVNLKISAFTQNNYLQQQSLFTYINKKQSQSSEFPEFTFDPIESQYFAESNYNLFFENKINIPANGYLQLSAKQLSINFLSSEIIQVFGNEIISSSKIVKQNQKFSLQLYFEKEVYGGMHLFRMQNINNPTYAQRQDYYTFQLESYDQYNNLLEYKEYDLYFIFICPQLNCLICNQQEFCDKCEANQILYQGQCLKECPQNTVFINQQCQRCNAGSSCLSCSNIDTVLCTKCSDGYDLINGFCIWTITQNSTQNQNTSNSNNNNNNNSNANNQDQQIQKNQNLKQQRLFDIHIFAIIVLSFAILSILRNIFRKQTDFFNAILAFSGISDFSQQFILFTIILVNYSTSQSIFSLTLCFVSIIQQLYAYQLIKLPLQVDFAYQRIQEIRFAKILKFLTLFIDWKIIFIHKSSITDSQLFFIHFQNEIKLQKLIKFLFLVKILVNLANLGMLGIILISQDQIAQLIYESTIYNLVMILIQLNKIYQIKLILENDNHNDAINSVVFLTNELNQDNENQDQNKITAKVTPESMIIQQN